MRWSQYSRGRPRAHQFHPPPAAVGQQVEFFLGFIDARNLVHQVADLPVHRVDNLTALFGDGAAGRLEAWSFCGRLPGRHRSPSQGGCANPGLCRTRRVISAAKRSRGYAPSRDPQAVHRARHPPNHGGSLVLDNDVSARVANLLRTEHAVRAHAGHHHSENVGAVGQRHRTKQHIDRRTAGVLSAGPDPGSAAGSPPCGSPSYGNLPARSRHARGRE